MKSRMVNLTGCEPFQEALEIIYPKSVFCGGEAQTQPVRDGADPPPGTELAVCISHYNTHYIYIIVTHLPPPKSLL